MTNFFIGLGIGLVTGLIAGLIAGITSIVMIAGNMLCNWFLPK